MTPPAGRGWPTGMRVVHRDEGRSRRPDADDPGRRPEQNLRDRFINATSLLRCSMPSPGAARSLVRQRAFRRPEIHPPGRADSAITTLFRGQYLVSAQRREAARARLHRGGWAAGSAAVDPPGRFARRFPWLGGAYRLFAPGRRAIWLRVELGAARAGGQRRHDGPWGTSDNRASLRLLQQCF